MSAEEPLRAVFMGTPPFAADILEDVSSRVEVVCVYTQPDRVRGRGNKTVPSAVKVKAQELGLPVRTVSSFKDPTSVEELASLKPDVICVAAFGAILPKAVLDIAPLGCVNVHGSILPRWRGAAPIERAILAGDAEAGVSIMRMEEGLDTGDFCICRKISIEDRSAEELTGELASLGAGALITAREQLRSGAIHWTKQDESQVTYAQKIAKHELDISPDQDAACAARRVQASSAAHPSKCILGNRTVTVLTAKVVEQDASDVPAAARVRFAQERLLLGCAEGALEVLSLKPDGKRAMTAQQFAQGMPGLKEGISWEAL